MGLFGISRELQFGICSHGEPRASLHAAREGELFYRGEKEVWRAAVVKRAHGFSLAESLPGKKRSLFPSCRALLWPQDMTAPPPDYLINVSAH